ncbi:MAG TPA: HlyD family secretion protein [Verrucomicrobiae bacterium]|nr:HlyD family secretion protein [Verrucomicrobiae bacterium]
MSSEQTTERLPPKRDYVKRAVIAVFLLVAGVGLVKLAHTWWTVGRFVESTDDAYVGGDVTVIAPKVAGFISKLAVVDNQQVHARDLLLKLDDRDYVAALAKAEAAVSIQKAALTNLDATRHLQEAVVAQAQATITAAEAEIVRTRDDQARFTKLLLDAAVSVQESQRADAEFKEAVALGEKSRAALTAAQRQVVVIDSQIQQVQAALKQADAERELARLNLSYTELRAPIDGTVGNRSAQIGAYATAGSQLLSIVPARGLWIDANFKESQLARIRPGFPVIVEVDSIPGRKFHGVIASLAPATGAQFSVLPPENATGNFTKIVQRVAVRILLDDEDEARGQLRPGLSVLAKVNTLSSGKSETTQRAGL